MEDIIKGITAKCEAITIGDKGNDSKVYWNSFFSLVQDVTFFEDRPELKLQDDALGRWMSEVGGVGMRSDLNSNISYKLSGSDRKETSMKVKFRFADEEKQIAGEEIEVSIQMWNEEVISQYMRDYLSIREPDKQGKPFSINLKIDTAQDNKIVMVYNKEKQPYPNELVELPQWTGDGPKIPKIQSAEVIDKKVVDVENIKTTFVVSGSGLEALNKDQMTYYLKVEFPVQPLPLPEGLEGGKFKWNNSYKAGDLVELKESQTVRCVYARNDKLFTGYLEDYNISMWFCYETPGGDIYTPAPIRDDGTGEKDEGIMESKVTLAAYNEELLQICMQKLREELSKPGNESEPFLCEFTITGYMSEDKKLIKTAGSNIAVNFVESLDPAQWEREQK